MLPVVPRLAREQPDDELVVSTRRLTWFYLVALGVVALLVMVGQVLVQRFLDAQAGDGQVINLAGRQRMLSQKVAKEALILGSPLSEAVRRQALVEIQKSVALWAHNHQVLQSGDEAANIQPRNSAPIRTLYESIQPRHEAMVGAVHSLVARALDNPGSVPTEEGARLIGIILREEGAFLAGMDAIVMNYESENRQRLMLLRRTEITLAVVILLTLVIEALFIFRPAIRQALRACEDRFRELFENAAEGIYESTLDGRWLQVNPAMARILGYDTPAELMAEIGAGKPDIYVEPTRREEFLASFRERDHHLGYEFEVKRRDGSLRWVSENVRVVRAEAAGGGRLQGFVVDITARKLAEQEWLRASKLESVGVLAGGIAHDFNNMLTAVLGNLSLAQIEAESVPAAGKYLRDAKLAIKRAGDLTQQLLTFAKGGEPVRAAISLSDSIREVAEFSLRGARSRCEFDLPADLQPVNADRGQISRVVQNLVINATQAMQNGGVIHIRARNDSVGQGSGRPLKPGAYVKISIIDHGIGIPKEHLGKIFDPYFTTKLQGSGLGLAAVYSIVKKHEGLIEVESEEGVGSVFHVWLPAADGLPTEAAARASGKILSGGQVLFMDDEESIRIAASGLLRHLGLKVALAANGGEAVQLFQMARQSGRPYDLVILDLTVQGGMGGQEALSKMKQIDPAVCALVSSGYSSDLVMANYEAYGFKGCIRKPYDMTELTQTLQRILGGKGD